MKKSLIVLLGGVLLVLGTPSVFACDANFIEQNVDGLQGDPIAREQSRRNLRDCGDASKPALLKLLQEESSTEDQRLSAINLLAQLSFGNEVIVVLLDKLKHDEFLTVRRDIARALGKQQEAKEQIAQALLQVLGNHKEHDIVRGVSADSLVRLGQASPAIVEGLQKVVSDPADSMDVRVDALSALREMGHLAVEVLPILLQEYLDPKSTLEKTVLRDSIISISKDLVVNERIDAESMVEKSQQMIEGANNPKVVGLDEVEFSLWHANKYLQILRWEKRFRNIDELKQWTGENQWVIAGPVYVVWLLLWLLIYRFYPLAILNASGYFEGINRFLPNTLSALPVKFFVFIPMLQYRPRVLEAWVKKELETARARYKLLPLVRAQQTHIPLPFELSDEVLKSMENPALTKLFGFQHSQLCILIWGEGGSGKSNLAVELGRCCLEGKSAGFSKSMLPVILDRDLKPDETLLAFISAQLHNLLDEPADSLSDEMIVALLKNKHVVLLVDHLSEMDDQTRGIIQPSAKDFLPRVVIITSRSEEHLDNCIRHVIKPLRLSGRQLADFCDQYLLARGKRKLYSDREFFELCKSLIGMAGEDGITPLFATLYLDQMAFARSRGRNESGPHSIPELMLHYLNTLNASVPEDERLPDRQLHRISEALAWLCMRRSFRPMPVHEDEIIQVSKGAIGAAQLNYLQHRLRLIDSVSASRDQVEFCIRPLAEHLAARHVVRMLGKSEDAWKQFILRCRQQLQRDPPVASFIHAVALCAQTYGRELQLPAFVVPSLNLKRREQSA